MPSRPHWLKQMGVRQDLFKPDIFLELVSLPWAKKTRDTFLNHPTAFIGGYGYLVGGMTTPVINHMPLYKYNQLMTNL